MKNCLKQNTLNVDDKNIYGWMCLNLANIYKIIKFVHNAKKINAKVSIILT